MYLKYGQKATSRKKNCFFKCEWMIQMKHFLLTIVKKGSVDMWIVFIDMIEGHESGPLLLLIWPGCR